MLRCVCALGWAGPLCESDLDECAVRPCANGGACSDGFASYTCNCAYGFDGSNCTIDLVDECVSGPCQHSGICTHAVWSYTCACPGGWAGENCDTDVDECLEPGLCKNGAECFNTPSSYVCSCSPGFQGTHCGEPIPTCDTVPNNCAPQNSKCTIVNAQQVCQCDIGYETPSGTAQGSVCLPLDFCDPPPCAHGPCTSAVDAFVCNCTDTGFRGPRCDTDVDECQSSPCSALGSNGCENGLNSYTCNCNDGWSGSQCTFNDYAGTEIAIVQQAISAAVFTTSSMEATFTIVSNGTAPLFISSVSVSVPWATVFQAMPGVTPSFSEAIQPGESLSLGVQFQVRY